MAVLVRTHVMNILRDKWVRAVGISLAIWHHLVRRYGLLLCINIWIRAKLSVLSILTTPLDTTLISELVVAIWVTKTSSERGRHASAWKIELLAKRRYMRHTCFALFVALVENPVGLLSNFWTDVTSLVLLRSFDGCSIVLNVLSRGSTINRFLQGFQLSLRRLPSLRYIYCGLLGIRSQDQMAWFLNIRSLLEWGLSVLNYLNFRSKETVFVALTIVTTLGFFLNLNLAWYRRKILILDCVLVMVWTFSLSLWLGNWLLNSSHSNIDLKIDQVSQI